MSPIGPASHAGLFPFFCATSQAASSKRKRVLERSGLHICLEGSPASLVSARFFSQAFQWQLSVLFLYVSLPLFGEGSGTPLQYSCLENLMDGGAWKAAVHGVAKSRTQPSDFTFTFHFHALEKEMATHSSVLAWRIPGTGEPDGLPSVGSHRVGHD